MATRKWVANDGKQFDTKAEVDAWEARKPHLDFLMGMLDGDAGKAEDVYRYFDKHFRVPVKRTPKKVKNVTPPTVGLRELEAAPAPKLVAAAKKDGK